MIFWTAILVVATGGVSALFMLQPPTKAQAAVESSSDARKLSPIVLAGSQREPASSEAAAVTAQPLDDRNDLQAVDLVLSCKGAQKTGFVKGVTQVRLSGDACTPSREIASTEIRNEANGFSATVFYPNAKSFTTDYMSLAHGANKIRILHVFKKGGREEREYLIDRQKE